MPKELLQVQGATMTTARELLQEAYPYIPKAHGLRRRIDAFLAQPEPEPVGERIRRLCVANEWVEPTDDGPMYCIPEAALASLNAAQPEPAAPAPDTVPVPLNADQAAGMVLIGTAWLEQNAPDRLRKPAPAPDADKIMALADEYANKSDEWGTGHPESWDVARAALRAEVERLVETRDSYLQSGAELLERAEAAERNVERLVREQADAQNDYRNLWDSNQHMQGEYGRQIEGLIQRAEAAERELDDVRKLDNRAFATWQTQRKALEERAEAAERDAERYRWLVQDTRNMHKFLPLYWEGCGSPQGLDAAIDAAIAQEKP